METQRKNVVVGVNRWVHGLRPSRRSGDPGFRPRRSVADVRKLIAGREIILSITSCDKLSSRAASRPTWPIAAISVSPKPAYSRAPPRSRKPRSAAASRAISSCKSVKAGGRVSGTIHYGKIEIECGGLIPVTSTRSCLPSKRRRGRTRNRFLNKSPLSARLRAAATPVCLGPRRLFTSRAAVGAKALLDGTLGREAAREAQPRRGPRRARAPA